jgi:uncharacterized membrane protein YjjB (DUF3815 family)
MLREFVLNMVYCFIATLFFAMIMNSPRRVLVFSSVIASFGYLIFLLCVKAGYSMLGFFLGTLVIAFIGEICARIYKMPATIFIFPAVVPIVPGFGLYQTVLAFVQKDILSALETGVSTIVNIGAMAIAMAVVSLAAIKIKLKPKN